MRRSVVWTLFVKFLVVFLSFCTCSATNRIVVENARQGTSNWWIKQSNSTPIAQGFSTKFSYEIGDTVQFKINSASVPTYHLGIFRLGYYGGKGGRMLSNLSVKSDNQPPCMFELTSRLTDCSNWRVSAEWTVPNDAVSGVYVAVPVSQSPYSRNLVYGSYIPFIVRQSKGRIGSDLLFKTADLTWVAYNKYGNWNVYRGNGSFSPDSRSFKASYDRPWQNRFLPPEGQNSNFLFGSEFAMLFWLEKQGYDVSYASCQDVEDMHVASVLVPQTATNDAHSSSPFKVLLSVGHDEYWTPELKTAYEAARENGVHLAFFSGNEVYWRVLWNEDTHAARHNLQLNIGPQAQNYINKSVLLDHHTQKVNVLHDRRVLVCRKETINSTASITPDDWTGTFRDPRHRSPEEESLLTGQWFMVNAHRKDAMEVTRDDATLRFWRNATFAGCATANCTQLVSARAAKKNLQTGDVVHTTPHGVLGYEWDVFPTDARPTGLFPLSTTRMHVEKHLVQNYGAQYKGSGQAIHRLSMYRHITTPSVFSHLHLVKRSQAELLQDVCLLKDSPAKLAAPRKSALVFGAGTIQWSWALSAWHDGPAMTEDRDLQQATLNLFADMDVLPTTLRDVACGKSCPPLSDAALVMPTGSSDTTAPTSSIMHVEFKAAHTAGGAGHSVNHKEPTAILSGTGDASEKTNARVVLRLRGRAEDIGGSVAAVEVTVDGGKSWHLASGRKRWYYVHHFVHAPDTTGVHSSAINDRAAMDAPALLREEMIKSAHLYNIGDRFYNTSMLVMSRAVDDSGWVEDTRINTLKALCWLGSKLHNARANVTTRNEFIRESVRIAPSAIVLKLR